ncbi:MAG: aldo/keto reductase [Halanaerobiaceae bacterium]
MEYTVFGDTGIEVSRLGFGAMRLPMVGEGDDKDVDYDKAVEMIHHAFENGVNYIDTALYYNDGKSEVAVGRALKGWRDQVYLSTKNPIKNDSGSDWRERLETSLEKLDTDYIDFYHMWGINWETFTDKIDVPNGPLEAAHQAKEEGLIKHISFSFHGSGEDLKKIVNTGHFESMLVQYNLLDRHNEEGIALAKEKGLGVVVMGPVGGGRLASPSTKLQNMMPGSSSSVETALKFVLANQNVDIALSGMENIDMVKQNIEIASKAGSLTAEEKKKVEEMVEENKKLADLYCTGCEYCLPCPQNVNIPRVFEIYNFHNVYGLTEHARSQYQELLDDEDQFGPRACVECGQCLDKCPQEIEIIEKLKEADKVLSE